MITQIVKPTRDWIGKAKAYIEAGEVVAFHTETVYGLGADASSDEAVRKIFTLKGRPADNPLIAHVHIGYDIARLIDRDAPFAEKLRNEFCRVRSRWCILQPIR